MDEMTIEGLMEELQMLIENGVSPQARIKLATQPSYPMMYRLRENLSVTANGEEAVDGMIEQPAEVKELVDRMRDVAVDSDDWDNYAELEAQLNELGWEMLDDNQICFIGQGKNAPIVWLATVEGNDYLPGYVSEALGWR